MKKKKFLREMRAEINRFEDIVADAVGILVSQGAAAYIDKSSEPVYVVECPKCRSVLLPVKRDGEWLLPEHMSTTDVQHICSGSNLPVSNTDKALKGE